LQGCGRNKIDMNGNAPAALLSWIGGTKKHSCLFRESAVTCHSSEISQIITDKALCGKVTNTLFYWCHKLIRVLVFRTLWHGCFVCSQTLGLPLILALKSPAITELQWHCRHADRISSLPTSRFHYKRFPVLHGHQARFLITVHLQCCDVLTSSHILRLTREFYFTGLSFTEKWLEVFQYPL
jgi:hypothetical protein